MAMKASSSVNGIGKQYVQRSLLDKFLARHSRLLTTAEDGASGSSEAETAYSNLFQPFKTATSGKWKPSVYSLRQQARLAKEAIVTDRLHLLPDSTVIARYRKRLALNQEHAALEEQLAQFRYIPEPPKDAVVSTKRGLHGRALSPSKRVSESERLEAARIASTHIKEIGPYAGRAKIFKGSKYDRNKPERLAGIQDKLASMPSVVSEWKQVRYVAGFMCF